MRVRGRDRPAALQESGHAKSARDLLVSMMGTAIVLLILGSAPFSPVRSGWRGNTMTRLRQFLSISATAVFVAGAAGCASTSDVWSTEQMFDDAALTARVRAALVEAERFDASGIKVKTHHGEVVLSGYVPSKQMSDRADLVAWKVDGVLLVRNDLHVARGR